MNRDFAWIAIAYVAALIAACITYLFSADLFSGSSLTHIHLWQMLVADVVATLVIFAFSCGFANSSFYDAYWSVAPPLIVLGWMMVFDQYDMRTLLVLLLVLLWAIRLTHNWARGWQGLSHVDWRYVNLKNSTGIFYPVVNLLGIQMLPTILVFLGCIPLYFAISSNASVLSLVDLSWLGVGFGALWLEYRADNVLRAFRQDPQNQGQVLVKDVWSWCRHPNYLGELGFWLALAVYGFITTSNLWSWLGFVCMVVLFVGISIPMIDKRQLENKPDYATYKKTLPALLPLGLFRSQAAD